jgi:hypothetical protein
MLALEGDKSGHVGDAATDQVDACLQAPIEVALVFQKLLLGAAHFRPVQVVDGRTIGLAKAADGVEGEFVRRVEQHFGHDHVHVRRPNRFQVIVGSAEKMGFRDAAQPVRPQDFGVPDNELQTPSA